MEVQHFVVYPAGYEHRVPGALPVYFLDDFDLDVATRGLEGRGPGGSEDGIVCVFVNQDDELHEVRATVRADRERLEVLTAAIEQLTIVRDQLVRLAAVK